MDKKVWPILGIAAITVWQANKVRRLHKCIERVVDVLYQHMDDHVQRDADEEFQVIVDNFEDS